MSHSRTPKRLPADALGMKALITTTSLAVTLGGWALLASEPAKPTTVTEAPPTDAVVAERPASEFVLNLPVLPTIVAPPPPPPAIVVDSPPPVAVTRPVARRPVVQVAAQPAPIAQPTPAAQLAPAAPPAAPPPPVVNLPLRVVSAPPKPVARTHSSR